MDTVAVCSPPWKRPVPCPPRVGSQPPEFKPRVVDQCLAPPFRGLGSADSADGRVSLAFRPVRRRAVGSVVTSRCCLLGGPTCSLARRPCQLPRADTSHPTRVCAPTSPLRAAHGPGAASRAVGSVTVLRPHGPVCFPHLHPAIGPADGTQRPLEVPEPRPWHHQLLRKNRAMPGDRVPTPGLARRPVPWAEMAGLGNEPPGSAITCSHCCPV